MPEIAAMAGKIAGIVSLFAFVPYIIAILKRETKPNRATWWIWSVVSVMLGTSYHSSGAEHTIWVAISYTIGPLVTALLSIKYGEGGWTRFDKLCLLGAGTSALLWWLFDSPIIALFANLFIDLMGLLPTIRKAYREPEGEDRVAWTFFVLGSIINLFAIESWTLTIVSYPIYMLLGSGTVATLLHLPRKPRQEDAPN